MVDTIMLASQGSRAVGAVGLCAQYTTVMFSCYWGFMAGGMLFYSQYWGAGDHHGIRRAYGTTLVFMMAVAFIFAGLALFRPGLVMSIYTDKAAIRAIGEEYLRIVGYAYVFQVFTMCVSALMRSTERVRMPLIATICAVACNVFFNWVFIFGRLGFEPMGVRGAAFATTLASALNVVILLLLAVFRNYHYVFQVSGHFRWTAAWIREYLQKSSFIIMNEVFVGAGLMGINIVLGHQSEDAIAAVAVFRVLEGFVIAFFSGVSNAASVLVGKHIGAGEHVSAYRKAVRMVPLCAFMVGVAVVLLLAFHKPLLHAMSLTGEAYRTGCGMLYIYSVASLLKMCNWTQNDTFRSSGETVYGTAIEILLMWLLELPGVYLAGMVFRLPVLWVFFFIYSGEPIWFWLMQKRLYSGRWIKPVTPQGKKAVKEFRRALAHKEL
ncbi:MAG: polysaccharide biosynthesis C-terminal domain-containing protein [Abditibacteriota bacterium]|nr:polysaccharide biosynthesis C-terminal domain-containing protein [Abditibacteriota bacterium]